MLYELTSACLCLDDLLFSVTFPLLFQSFFVIGHDPHLLSHVLLLLLFMILIFLVVMISFYYFVLLF